MKKELSFDWMFHSICQNLPLLGKPLLKYYDKHGWFQRFAKFGVSTSILFWFVKGPLIWLFTGVIPSLNLFLFTVPSYLFASFIAGLLLTLIGFVLNEAWVWEEVKK